MTRTETRCDRCNNTCNQGAWQRRVVCEKDRRWITRVEFSTSMRDESDRSLPMEYKCDLCNDCMNELFLGEKANEKTSTKNGKTRATPVA
jgi:RNase P subunit RPR2